MRKFTFFLFFIISTSLSSIAKDIYQDGKLILKTGDTIVCKINVYKPFILLNYKILNYKIEDKIFELEYDDIETIFLENLRFDRIIYNYLMPSTKESNLKPINKSEKVFAAVVEEGNFKLYKYYFTIDAYSGYSTSETLRSFYFISFKKSYEKISKINFKKDCKKVFPNCFDILKRLDEKVYNYDSIQNLVKYANEKCAGL